MDLERRVKKLEWWNRLLVLGVAALLGYGFTHQYVPAKRLEKLIRVERLEIVDKQGEPAVIAGFDADGAAGLFIKDPRGSMRVALAHDDSGSALFLRDADGTIRVGVAQFAHGGGGVALHGPGSQGAAVLYFKESPSLTFYDPQGNPTVRLPQEPAD